MENIAIQAIAATTIVSLISLIIAILLVNISSRVKLPLILLVAFAAGSLVGDVFLHLLPEIDYNDELAMFVLLGIGLSLLLEAGIHCYNGRHQHEVEVSADKKNIALPYLSLISDSLHNLLDGISIAASFLISPGVGVMTTLAIIFHEIPQEIADVGILIRAHWSNRRVIWSNLITALTAILGALFALLLVEVIPQAVPAMIALAAGQLVYVALADLLPEIHHHQSKRSYFATILSFAAGIGVMWLLTLAETL